MYRLSQEALGARCYFYRLPPITFIEYLYFTDRIQNYREYNCVTGEDFSNYLQLKDLPSGLVLRFDKNYFMACYKDVEVANYSSRYNSAHVQIKSQDLSNLSIIVGYNLCDSSRYDKFIEPVVGGKERIHLDSMGVDRKRKKIDFSNTLVNMSKGAIQNLNASNKASILHFLLETGMAFIDYMWTERTMGDNNYSGNNQYQVRSFHEILTMLKQCNDDRELRNLIDGDHENSKTK